MKNTDHKKEKPTKKLKFEVNNLTSGTGACQVDGCGCTEYKDNDGTCWNLNSSGGTCNHLENDHAPN